MRCWKQYLIEEDIHLCCVTETHMDSTREEDSREIFEDEFQCSVRIRGERKRIQILYQRSHGVLYDIVTILSP